MNSKIKICLDAIDDGVLDSEKRKDHLEIHSTSDALLSRFGFPSQADHLLTEDHKKRIVRAVAEFFKFLVLSGNGRIKAVRTICLPEQDPLLDKIQVGGMVSIGGNWSFSGIRRLGDPCEVSDGGILVSVTTTLECGWIDWKSAVYTNSTSAAGSWHEREIQIDEKRLVPVDKLFISKSWSEMSEWVGKNCDWADTEKFYASMENP